MSKAQTLTFRCAGCGETFPAEDEAYPDSCLCADCLSYAANQPDETDSWGDHDPHYDW